MINFGKKRKAEEKKDRKSIINNQKRKKQTQKTKNTQKIKRFLIRCRFQISLFEKLVLVV